MTTFITRLDAPGSGTSVAVKDLIDVAGVPTTAGSRAVAETAAPADGDAACLRGIRAAAARIVGKANLFELAYGASGVNEWFGTPVNPLDPELVPGGSSSGSAVAVATGEADVALGSDTGGSIRVPSAFCGTAGLKTTHGRVPLDRVWPLAPSLDTVGPMARDMAGVLAGMALLEPGFGPAPSGPRVLGRLRTTGIDVDPAIDAAVDRALAETGFQVVAVELDGLSRAFSAGVDLLDAEAAVADAHLMRDPTSRAKLGALVASRLEEAATIPAHRVKDALRFQGEWRAELARLFTRVEILALPTVAFFPPPLTKANGVRYTRLTLPFNLAGCPALALPVPSGARLPASLQLVGPADDEELVVATGCAVERAVGKMP